MDTSEIEARSVRFREAITSVPRSNFPWNSSMGISQFPSGCCGDASQTLATYLHSELGIVCDYVHGEKGGKNNEIGSHAWLEIEGIVIDITADQFNDRGYNLHNVYVGPKTDWYESFETSVTKDGRHTSLSDKGSLEAVYAAISQKL
ncbi:MAG: hypothetical protein VX595_05740 [Pseudomonadota bacterium]|nr:hypothetical protein [Pseudomonadota bacterium]